jgi:hypothetical protein
MFEGDLDIGDGELRRGDFFNKEALASQFTQKPHMNTSCSVINEIFIKASVFPYRMRTGIGCRSIDMVSK